MANKTIYEKKGGIAYLTINNPEKANVMDDDVIEEMGQEYRDFWEDRDMRVMIITGAGGRHFSAGHNIQPPPDGMTYEDVRQDRIDQFIWPPAAAVNGRMPSVDLRSGHDFPQIWKPVIGAVNGWAAGAGLYTLLTTTDIRIGCEEHARFYFALLSNRGGIGSGPTVTRLIRQIPYVHAMKMLLTDSPVDANEAVRMNLINEAVPHDQLMARCEEIANRICEMPPIAVRFLKEFLVRGADMNTDQAWHLQWVFNHLVGQHSSDSDDATPAFLEKRGRDVSGDVRGDSENDSVGRNRDERGFLTYDRFG